MQLRHSIATQDINKQELCGMIELARSIKAADKQIFGSRMPTSG